MNEQEFELSVAGADLTEASEALFQAWYLSTCSILPEPVARELYNAGFGR